MTARGRSLAAAWAGAAALALVAACVELPVVRPGECGNGVLEPAHGEDCDTFPGPAAGEGALCGAPGTTHACRLLCARGQAQPSCPAGWGCSPAGFCQRAAGEFQADVALVRRHDALAAGDLDGDGRLDVVLHDDAEIRVLFDLRLGAAATLPSAEWAVPSLADVDDDGRMDVVTPHEQGVLVATGQQDRRLEPIAFSAELLDVDPELPGAQYPEGGVRTVPFRHPARAADLLASVALLPGEGRITVPGIAEVVSDAALAGAAWAGVGAVPRANLDDDPWEEAVVALPGQAEVVVLGPPPCAGAPETCAACLPGGAGCWGVPARDASIPLPPGWTVALDSAVLVFDANADGALDVFVGAESLDGGLAALVAGGDGAGGFAAAAPDDRFGRPDWFDCALATSGGVPGLPLATADLDRDGLADFVVAEGIFLGRTDGACQAHALEGPWARAVVGDFNADGALDAAGLRQSEPLVDLLLGDGRGRFSPFRVPSEIGATRMVSADMDGDFVPDLVLSSDGLAGLAPASRLDIHFGVPFAAPSPPVTIGTLDAVEYLEPYQDGGLLAADLLVQSVAAEGAHTLAHVVGSSVRPPVAPYPLWNGAERARLQNVLAGRFDPSGDAAIDLVAIDGFSVWLLPGAGGGGVVPGEAVALALPPLMTADSGAGLWLAGPLDGADPLSLVSFACDAPACVRVMRFVGDRAAPSLEVRDLELDGVLLAGAAALPDLDGDGRPELVVADLSVEEGRVAVAWSFDGRTPPELATVGPGRAFVALQGIGDARVDLAVLRDDGIYLHEGLPGASFSEGRRVASRAASGGGLGLLAAGDVTGDGLDDLILGDGQRVSVFAAVPARAGAW